MTLYAIAKKDEWVSSYLIASKRRNPEFAESPLPSCLFTSEKAAFRFLHKQTKELQDACEVQSMSIVPIGPVTCNEVFPKYSIAGGNAGILVRGCIPSTTSHCCPRVIALRNARIEEPPSKSSSVTFSLGSLLELPFAEANPNVQMNFRPPETLLVTENCGLGLEADGLDRERRLLWELKSISSTKTLKSVFGEGQYKIANVIQLAYYLLFLDSEETPINSGILRYTSVIYDSFTCDKVKYNIKAGDTRDFKVQWNGETLFVDDKPTGITAESISRFVEFVAWVLENNPPVNEVLTPVDESGTRVSCMYCYWREECQCAEQLNLSMQEFMDLCAKKI